MAAGGILYSILKWQCSVLIRIYDGIKEFTLPPCEGLFHGIFMGFHFLAHIVWANIAWSRMRILYFDFFSVQ